MQSPALEVQSCPVDPRDHVGPAPASELLKRGVMQRTNELAAIDLDALRAVNAGAMSPRRRRLRPKEPSNQLLPMRDWVWGSPPSSANPFTREWYDF